MNKIVRSICYFSSQLNDKIIQKLNYIEKKLLDHNYIVQTKRLCSPTQIQKLEKFSLQNSINYYSFGTLNKVNVNEQFNDFLISQNVSFNIELGQAEKIDTSYIDLLFEVIKKQPQKTFNFTYVFNNKDSSPYFPSASYKQDGFSIGLQPTDLTENCKTQEEWFVKMEQCWQEIFQLFKTDTDFLGIDSSIAPLFEGKSSLINFVKKLGYTFEQSSTTDFYLKITKFIKNNNPKPVGLCGIMFPCAEDFVLAREYEKGKFSIERNLFLSLHSGLGIDTYPIGVDENKERILQVLTLIKELSNKYNKPLSARFVSDGRSKIGEETNFKNQFLKDVIIRKL